MWGKRVWFYHFPPICAFMFLVFFILLLAGLYYVGVIDMISSKVKWEWKWKLHMCVCVGRRNKGKPWSRDEPSRFREQEGEVSHLVAIAVPCDSKWDRRCRWKCKMMLSLWKTVWQLCMVHCAFIIGPNNPTSRHLPKRKLREKTKCPATGEG